MPHPCRRALDVGCGAGRFANRLAGLADHVDAIDRAPIDRPTASTNVTFLAGDFLHFGIEAGAYDSVYAIASVHHMPFETALMKMSIALRPGGVLGVIGLF